MSHGGRDVDYEDDYDEEDEDEGSYGGTRRGRSRRGFGGMPSLAREVSS